MNGVDAGEAIDMGTTTVTDVDWEMLWLLFGTIEPDSADGQAFEDVISEPSGEPIENSA